MKVRCDRNELLERLQSVAAVVSSAPTTKPILQCALLSADDRGFEVKVTDLDNSTRLVVVRHEIEQPGRVALPAARLVSLLRELPGGGVTFETGSDPRDVSVRAESYQFRLLGDDPEEFPEIRQFAAENALVLSREKLAEMLRRVGVASARDASRYQLAGIFVEIDGEELRMTATDGKRLTHDSMRIRNSNEMKASAIIANRAVDSLCRIAGHGSDDVRFAILGTEVQVAFEHGEFMAKLIEGTFPEYRSVIPKDVKTRVKTRRVDFLQAAKSASLVTDKETATILFRFQSGEICLESKASDIGESRITIPAEVQGDDIEIRFNPVYFIDALRAVNDEEVRLELYGPGRPGAVRGGQNYRHFLMPLVVG